MMTKTIPSLLRVSIGVICLSGSLSHAATIVYGFETTTTAMNGSNTGQTATVPVSSNDFGSGIMAGDYSAVSPVGGIQSVGSQMRALKKADTDTHTFSVTVPDGVTVDFTNLSFSFGRVGGDTSEPVWAVSSNLAGGTFTPSGITGSGTGIQNFSSALAGNFTGVTNTVITFTLTDAAGGNNNSTSMYTWIDSVTLTGAVVIPEPSTVLLTLGGLCALTLHRRRH